MVQVIVRAGVDIDIQLAGRNQHRHAAGEIDTRVLIGQRAIVGQVHVGRDQCPFGRLEDVAILAQPPDRYRAFVHAERADLLHQSHTATIVTYSGGLLAAAS